MRILIVPKDFPSEQRPGAGIFILRRAQALRDLGHDVSVLRMVPAAPPFGRKWEAYRAIREIDSVDGIPVRTVRAIVPPRMLAMEYVHLQLRGALEKEILRFKPDIAHASFLVPCGQLVARQRMVPSVVTAHGIDAHKWPKLRPGLWRASREAVANADGVTAVSGYIADRLRELYPRDVRVIWNGADERFFYPRDRAASRQALDLPPDRGILAFVGNLLPVKGLADLLQAVHRIAPHRRPLLAIGGDGPELHSLRAAAQELNVEARFLGHLQTERIAQLVGAADAVTLPSYAEGLPNVICEAMLSERAVVATTVGGIPEIVQHGKSGLLVPPGSPAELAVALDTLFEDSLRRDAMARQGRAFALTHLTWRVSAKAYEAFYNELLSPRRPEPAYASS